MRYFAALIIVLIITLYGQDKQDLKTMAKKVTKSESEWATCLTSDEYRVLREKGTEMAFTHIWHSGNANIHSFAALVYAFSIWHYWIPVCP